MSKVVKFIVVAIFGLVPFVGVSNVSAQQFTCDIGYTGPDSSNVCTSTTTYKCTVTNKNEVEIKNDNDQVVGSGSVSVSDNTQGGSAGSGEVANVNGGTFSVVITNPAPSTEQPGVCTATSKVPATPVTPTPSKPEVLSGGAGAAGGAGAVAVLPNTQGTQTFSMLTIASVAVAIATTISGVVYLMRRRLGL